jgi:DNA/RNA-binding domain of Phe-tRNA-synthetase-like protein
VDDEFDQLENARAKAASELDAHVRRLWQQDVDQAWRDEYERLKARCDDADNRCSVYLRSREGRS